MALGTLITTFLIQSLFSRLRSHSLNDSIGRSLRLLIVLGFILRWISFDSIQIKLFHICFLRRLIFWKFSARGTMFFVMRLWLFASRDCRLIQRLTTGARTWRIVFTFFYTTQFFWESTRIITVFSFLWWFIGSPVMVWMFLFFFWITYRYGFPRI